MSSTEMIYGAAVAQLPQCVPRQASGEQMLHDFILTPWRWRSQRLLLLLVCMVRWAFAPQAPWLIGT